MPPPSKKRRTKVGVSAQTQKNINQSYRIVSGTKDQLKLTDLEKSGFVETYHRKYCLPRLDYCTPIDTFLSHYSLSDDNKEHSKEKPNLTALAGGGKWYIPPNKRIEYFDKLVETYAQDGYIGLNEQVSPEQHAALALELDYRFSTLQEVPSQEQLEEHIRAIHTIINHVIQRPFLRMVVFGAEPKPKWSNGTYKVALGLHIIFNCIVSVEDGAMLSNIARNEILEKFNLDVVDNIYIAGTGYTGQPHLRPPLSAKCEDCYFCNPRNRPDREKRGWDCKRCKGFGWLLDSNTYKLRAVYDAEGNQDKALEQRLRDDMSYMLQYSSIWGILHDKVRIQYPKEYPIMTAHEIAMDGKPPPTPLHVEAHQRAAMTEQDTLLTLNKHGKKQSYKNVMVSFGLMHVKCKGDKGMEVPMTPDLLKAIKDLIAQVDPHYGSVRVAHLVAFGNGDAVRVDITHTNATYCVIKKDFHSSNRAVLWIRKPNPMIFVGCYSNNGQCAEHKYVKWEDAHKLKQRTEICQVMNLIENQLKMRKMK